jgi:hypothetical protein
MVRGQTETDKIWNIEIADRISGDVLAGTKILNEEGLFIPMLVTEGINELILEIIK